MRYLRLGNMLLRKRPRAAVVEYERGREGARQAGGGGDAAAAWLFPVKLGRTYLALAEPDARFKAPSGQGDLSRPPLAQRDRGAGVARQGRPAPTAIRPLRTWLGTNPFDPHAHCRLADAYGRVHTDARAPPSSRSASSSFCHELGAAE